MIEEGADEKLQREVEEQLKFAELERMMMQEEQEAGDLQVILFISRIVHAPYDRLTPFDKRAQTFRVYNRVRELTTEYRGHTQNEFFRAKIPLFRV